MRQQASLSLNFYLQTANHSFLTFDINPGGQVSNELIPKHDRNAGGLPLTLHISIGTRIMLLRNLLTEEGLVNGAMGTVHKLSELGWLDVLLDELLSPEDSTVHYFV